MKEFYRKQYKRLLIIPFLILFLAIGQIVYQVATTGDFMDKDVELKGGISIKVPVKEEVDVTELDSYLSEKFPEADIKVSGLYSLGKQTEIVVKSTLEVNETELIQETRSRLGLSEDEEVLTRLIDASFGAAFFKHTFFALIFSFLLMGILVFIYFKVPIPSLAVVLSAFSDIVATMATMNILGIKLTTGSIAALLMLIGYSVDTDILLSTRILKRKEGDVFDRTLGAMRTGITMTITTLAAILVVLIFSRAELFKQVAVVLVIGLLFDLVMTWLQNAGILRLYLEKKGAKHESSW